MADVKTEGRKSKAAETRRRMLDAAIRCFTASGYQATTMATIAEEAGVAVQTLYFTFKTKAGLLQETFDRAVLGDGPPVAPSETDWYQAMTVSRSLSKGLEHLVDGVMGILERVAALRPVFDSAREEDGVAEVWQRGERLREQGYREIIETLSTKRPLRQGYDLDRATDVLLLLLGPDAFRSLVGDRGWSAERWAVWTRAIIERELFDTEKV